MYEELIQALREHADKMCVTFKRAHACGSNLTLQAADAIEELAKDLERSKNYEAFWNEEAEKALRRFQVAVASKPRWIPVTETKKLPKDGQPVFIHIPARFRKTVSIPMIAYRDQGTWREQETHRDVYNMTHWMPLPEPPKEKTE